jgi:HD-GYP domain-containing protein (c-di-GMP phosphodiesterase class II)
MGTFGEDNQENLIRENAFLRRLLDIHRRLSSGRQVSDLFPDIVTEFSRLLEVDRSSLFVFDWENLELRPTFAEGVDTVDFRIRLRMGIVGSAMLMRRMINVGNAYNHPFFNPDVDQAAGFVTNNTLVTPIPGPAGKAIGAIQLVNKAAGPFDADDEAAITAAAQGLDETTLWNQDSPARARDVVRGLMGEARCDRGTLFRLDREGGEIRSLFAEGLEDQTIRLGLNLGIAGLVAVTQEPLIVNDAAEDARFNSGIDRQTGYVTRSLLAAPLLNKDGDTIGVIEAINKVDGPFTDADRDATEVFSSAVGSAMDSAILFEEQERQFQSILEVMAASIDAKDHLTAGHSARVREVSEGIARAMNFSDSEIDVVAVAALLHDYGKIGVDDQVLKKPGKLTDDEYSHIQTHVTITRQVLDKMRFARKYRNVPLIAASHHETLDGKGYSGGLGSEQIPFMAKILAVADVFEALTADRHYRKAMTEEVALEVLEKGAVVKYDPDVLAALGRFLAAESE